MRHPSSSDGLQGTFIAGNKNLGVLYNKYQSPSSINATINTLQLKASKKGPHFALLAHSLATISSSSKKSIASPLPRAPSSDYLLLLPPNVAKALLAKDPHPVGNEESAYLQSFRVEAIDG